MNIHFTGIGGIGISALAQFCKNRGDKVTGSDVAGSELVDALRGSGIEVVIPHSADSVPKDTDLLIYTEAVSADNSERLVAAKLGIEQQSYFEYLGEISQDFRTIAVCGTHGKTTTVGLVAAGFLSCGFDATVFVGTKLRGFGGNNFYAGTNDYLLLEACEYRNNFQYLRPEIVLLTNAELDHVDFYQNEAHYLDIFTEFCSRAETVIYHEDDLNAHKVLQRFSGEIIPVAEPYLKNVLQIHGEHNRKNAALAVVLAEKLNLDVGKFDEGLRGYVGAWRRQEFLGEKNGQLVFDDYGHHPTEIRATLAAFRERFPGKKITLIFEAHQHSRTRHFFDEFVEALGEADFVGVFQIYAARDSVEDKASVSAEDLVRAVSGARKIETVGQARELAGLSGAGDVVLFMGAGVVDQFAGEFVTGM